MINKYSFQPGWDKVRPCDQERMKKALMEARGITSDIAWRNCKSGRVEPKASKKEAIENVFRSYGIRTGIWGYETEEYKSANAAGA